MVLIALVARIAAVYHGRRMRTRRLAPRPLSEILLWPARLPSKPSILPRSCARASATISSAPAAPAPPPRARNPPPRMEPAARAATQEPRQAAAQPPPPRRPDDPARRDLEARSGGRGADHGVSHQRDRPERSDPTSGHG